MKCKKHVQFHLHQSLFSLNLPLCPAWFHSYSSLPDKSRLSLIERSHEKLTDAVSHIGTGFEPRATRAFISSSVVNTLTVGTDALGLTLINIWKTKTRDNQRQSVKGKVTH